MLYLQKYKYLRIEAYFCMIHTNSMLIATLSRYSICPVYCSLSQRRLPPAPSSSYLPLLFPTPSFLCFFLSTSSALLISCQG